MNTQSVHQRTPVTLGKIKQSRQFMLMFVWGGLLLLYVMSTFVFKNKSVMLEWAWLTALLLPLAPWLLNRRAIRALEVISVQCAPFHKGSTGAVRVDVGNKSAQLIGDIEVSSPSIDESAEGDLEPRAKNAFIIPLKKMQRGIHSCPDVLLSTAFPFGMFASRRLVSPGSECVVYPASEENAPPWPDESSNQMRLSRAGDEVVAFRDYVSGDAVSTIDWKITARHDDLIVRQFEEPVRAALVFTYASVSGLDLESALSRLTSWVLRAHARGIVYGLDLEGDRVLQGSGHAHRNACLRRLARFRQEAQQ